MAKSWFAFMGGEVHDPLSYYRINVKHNCLCGHVLCAIYADSNGVYPETPFSANMQKYIADGLSTGQIQPEYPVRSKKYVYLKDL